MSHPKGSLGDLIGMDDKPKHRKPAKTAKGKDIELHASDGQRVKSEAQRGYTPQPKKDTPKAKEPWSPFRKVAKALGGQ